MVLKEQSILFQNKKNVIVRQINFSLKKAFFSFQLSVRLKKNPGLGFSIAGGITGAETVRLFL